MTPKPVKCRGFPSCLGRPVPAGDRWDLSLPHFKRQCCGSNPKCLEPGSVIPWLCYSVFWQHIWYCLMVSCRNIELDDGKIYRKALDLMVKTMVSCRFSQQNQSNDRNNALSQRFFCFSHQELLRWQIFWHPMASSEPYLGSISRFFSTFQMNMGEPRGDFWVSQDLPTSSCKLAKKNMEREDCRHIGVISSRKITIFVGGINLPFPVMGGADDIVLPTLKSH